MSITVSTSAKGGFTQAFTALPKNAETLVSDTLTVIEAIDRALCPYDPDHDPKDGPHLKDTIRQDRKDPYNGDVVEGEGTQGQGIFTEYGTNHGTYSIAAQPHQTPAAALAWQTEMSKRLGKLFSS